MSFVKRKPLFGAQSQVVLKDSTPQASITYNLTISLSFEPCRGKTYLWGFRPGSTQIGLYSYRRWLEA